MDGPAVLCGLVAMGVLAMPLLSWRRTWQARGRIDAALVCRVLDLSQHTRVRSIGLLAGVALLGAVTVPVFGWPIGLSFINLALGLFALLRIALPPAVLFLSGTGERAGDFFSRLQLAAFPLRTVALLDPVRIRTLGLELDLLRSPDDRIWKTLVLRLMDIAQVYVVDTVHRTAPVRYEIFQLLDPARAGRTIFVSNDSGECPSLIAEGIDPGKYAIPVTTPARLEAAVRRMLRAQWGQWRDADSDDRQGVIREGMETLPTVLMIGLEGGLDGRWILERVRETDKELICLFPPQFARQTKEGSERIRDLAADFMRDRRIAGLHFESNGVAIIRRDLLLANAGLLDIKVAGLCPGHITWEQLNQPEPVRDAIFHLCSALRNASSELGLKFRFTIQ